MIWQPNQHIGAALVNSPGTLTWNELSCPDFDAAEAFYGGLFGWAFAPFEGSPEPYLLIQNGERGNGGIRPLTPPGVPPHWLVYFGVADLDAALGKLEELGGARVTEPIDIQVGKIAIGATRRAPISPSTQANSASRQSPGLSARRVAVAIRPVRAGGCRHHRCPAAASTRRTSAGATERSAAASA